MKSIVKEENVPVLKRDYPYLGKYVNQNQEGCIVLFMEKRAGTVVGITGKKNWHIGHFSASWLENEFTVFNGEIFLKND